MPGLHAPELIIVLAIALLIFGPKKLPEMGSSIGKSIKAFRKGMNEAEQDKLKEETVKPISEYKSPEAMRQELDDLERELAAKKTASASYEKTVEAAPRAE
jgi:sec-independent protein translocase protein TatA